MVSRETKVSSSVNLISFKKISESLLDIRTASSSIPPDSYHLPKLRINRSEYPSKSVMLKRQRGDLDLSLNFPGTKSIEELFPAARKELEWKRSSKSIKITVSTATPEVTVSHIDNPGLPTISQVKVVRRSSKVNSEKEENQDTLLTPFSEVIEKKGDAKGASPYLAVSQAKPRLSKTLSSPVSPSQTRSRAGPVSCTCSLRLYLTASLHYQQLFLRAAPSMAVIEHFPRLSNLYVNTGDSGKLTVVLVFDGAVGDWHKKCMYDESPYKLRLRKKVIPGLMALQQRFNLVFVSRMNRHLCLHVLGYFRTYNIDFHAAYRIICKSPGPESHSRQFLCYHRLERDLAIPSREMLVLTGINLAHEDLSPELLYVKQGTKCYLTADYVPVAIPAQDGLPMTCLVPSIEAQHSCKILDFESIASVMIDYSWRCRGLDWTSGFHPEYEQTNFQLISTLSIHQVLMSQLLPQPRADAFLYPPAHTCTLHARPAWGSGPSIHPFTSKVMMVINVPRSSAHVAYDVIDTQSVLPKSGYQTLLDYSCSHN